MTERQRAGEIRTCLHCVLQRALRAETDDLLNAHLRLTVTRSEPVWLPEAGTIIYRHLRRLLRESMKEALPGTPLKISVIDQVGKSYVEVTAVFRGAEGWRTASCSLARYELENLWGGFAESAG